MSSPRYTSRPIVLFDADCGFCRWSVAKLLAWDRRGNLRPVAIQSDEGRRLLDGMSEEERMASWHLVGGGERFSGGDAFPPLLRLLPGGSPLAELSARVPRVTAAAYEAVARHRSAIGRLVPAAARRRADERIRRRER